MKDKLFEGELILWEGKPRHGFIFQPFDYQLIPISITPFSVAVLLLYIMIQSNFHFKGLQVLLYAFIVLFGFTAFAGRYVIDALKRASNRYVITESQVIIKGGVLKKYLEKIDRDDIEAMEIIKHYNGTATVAFFKPHKEIYAWIGRENWLPKDDFYRGFRYIKDYQRVLNILEKDRAVSE